MTGVLYKAAVVFLLTYAAAYAQEMSCDPALFKDYVSSKHDLSTTIHVLRTIDDRNFETFKQNFSGDITLPIEGTPVDFGSTFSSFDAKRKEVVSKYAGDFSTAEASSDLKIKFSGLSGSAYSACLGFASETIPGLHLVPEGLTGDSVTIKLVWRNPPGTTNPLRVQYSGAGPTQTVQLAPNGSHIFSISRNKDEDIRIDANAENGQIAWLLIPRIELPPRGKPCEAFQADHADTTACNQNTAVGYFWRVAQKLQNYGTGPIDPENSGVSVCSPETEGSVAMTFRFPLTQANFQEVRAVYAAPNNGEGGDPQCRHTGNNVEQTKDDKASICGVFRVICTKQF